MRGKLLSALILVMTVALSFGVQEAKAVTATTKKFTATTGGTVVSIDVDNTLCTAPDGVTICSVLPLYFNYTGRSINGIGNIAFSYSGQSTAEITPTAGTGCLIDTTVASCTLGTSTDACAFTVTSGNYTNQQTIVGNRSQNFLVGSVSSGSSLCVDFSSAPYNFSGTINATIDSGVGTFTGFTGSFIETLTGQFTTTDMLNPAFGWFTATIAGSQTTGAVAVTQSK